MKLMQNCLLMTGKVTNFVPKICVHIKLMSFNQRLCKTSVWAWEMSIAENIHTADFTVLKNGILMPGWNESFAVNCDTEQD